MLTCCLSFPCTVGPQRGGHSTEKQCLPAQLKNQNRVCVWGGRTKKNNNKYADIVKVFRGGGVSLGCHSRIPPGLEYRSSTTACLFSDADLHSTKYSRNPCRGARSQSRTTWMRSPSATRLLWEEEAARCSCWARETLSSQRGGEGRGWFM